MSPRSCRASTAAQLARKSSSGERAREGRESAQLMLSRQPARQKLMGGEKVARGPREREADALPRARGGRGHGRFAAIENRGPIDSGGGRRPARDGGSPADLSRKQAFALEHFISCGNRGTVQSKQTSHFASGWYPLSPDELAGTDSIGKLLIKLPVQRQLRQIRRAHV